MLGFTVLLSKQYENEGHMIVELKYVESNTRNSTFRKETQRQTLWIIGYECCSLIPRVEYLAHSKMTVACTTPCF